MNPVREIVRNASETHRLARRYYWLTSCVGLLGVGVGIVVMLLAAQTFAAILGISENAALGTQPNSTLWLVGFLVSIPISIYLGCVIVAGIFATTMVWLGKFSVSEAIHYALLSRYPASWRRR